TSVRCTSEMAASSGGAFSPKSTSMPAWAKAGTSSPTCVTTPHQRTCRSMPTSTPESLLKPFGAPGAPGLGPRRPGARSYLPTPTACCPARPSGAGAGIPSAGGTLCVQAKAEQVGDDHRGRPGDQAGDQHRRHAVFDGLRLGLAQGEADRDEVAAHLRVDGKQGGQ